MIYGVDVQATVREAREHTDALRKWMVARLAAFRGPRITSASLGLYVACHFVARVIEHAIRAGSTGDMAEIDRLLEALRNGAQAAADAERNKDKENLPA